MDLIDRQAAIDSIERLHGGCITNDVKNFVRYQLLSVPSAEKRGEWETAMLDHEAFGVRPTFLYCSCCNRCVEYPTRFCPNCGAKMED